MIVCPKCGKELADGTKFCSKCGEKIVAATQEVPVGMIQCPKCGKQLKAGTKFCMGCGAALSDVVANAQENKPEAATAQEAPKAEEVKKEEPKAEAPKAEEVKAEVQKQEEPKAEPAKTVEPKKEEVKAEEPKKEEVKPEEPKKEEAKKEEAKKEEAPKQNLFANPMVKYGCIAAAVIVVLILLGGLLSGGGSRSGKHYAMYLKDKEIMYSTLKQKGQWQVSTKLIKDGGYENGELRKSMKMYYCSVSEDGKRIFFPDKLERGDDGVTLYTRLVNNQKKEPQKIDSSIDGHYISKDGMYVTYIKTTDDLYQFSIKKDEKTKIDSDVYGYRASKDGSKVYYNKQSGELYVWTQSKKEKEKIDSDIKKIVAVSEDYKTVYYIKDGSLYKKTGNKDREKISSDVKSVFAVYNSGEAYFSKSESDFESIWYYDGKETTKLTERMVGYPTAATETPVLAFRTADEDNPKDRIFNVAVKKDVKEIDCDDPSNVSVDQEGKFICYIDDVDTKSEVGDLYKLTISGGKAATKGEKFDSDVSTSYIGVTKFDQVLYYKECSNTTGLGELYCDKKKIDSDVGYLEFVYCNETKEIVYLADVDANKGMGTLKIANSKTGKSKKIADDIYEDCYTLVPGGSVLYLYDYSQKYYKGELYLYKGGKATKIDDEVTMILSVD